MMIKIKYRMLSPLSHIGEVASTGAYFQTVLTSGGRVPVITGNSVRGQLRDNIALHLLEQLDTKVGKEVFHVLFSGGGINGSMRDDVERAKAVREHFPMISLLGGALGDMIMAGKMMVSFAYPICEETWEITGIPSLISWHSLTEEIEFTRTDDSKNDQRVQKWIDDVHENLNPKVATQMRYSVQYMAAGTEFVQNIRFLPNTTPLEMGVFYAGLLRWFACPKLGGMSAKGFGVFDAEVGEGDIVLRGGEVQMSDRVRALVRDYEDFVQREGAQYFSLLQAAKGGKKRASNAD